MTYTSSCFDIFLPLSSPLPLKMQCLTDIRYLDTVNPKIAKGSEQEDIVNCARTVSKIFIKITVLVRPCCFTFLQALMCQQTFANILHRVQNDWMHPSLLVDKEEMLVGLMLAYESV